MNLQEQGTQSLAPVVSLRPRAYQNQLVFRPEPYGWFLERIPAQDAAYMQSIGRFCSAPDCQSARTHLIGHYLTSVVGTPKKEREVCRFHAEAFANLHTLEVV